MCIFSQPVNSVNGTKIFARSTGKGSQFLAYQMNYDSQGENAMILPIPVRSPSNENCLRFIDLQDYEYFFYDLAKGFPYVAPSFNFTCGGGPKAVSDAAIKLHKVGSYIASFVPTIDDFKKLDPRFTLPKKTWDLVPQYASYGFAVFQLASGALESHPMAFEFDSNSKSIYFPTMHIHDGEVHETEAFDHVLYMQHAGLDSKVNRYVNYDVADESTGYIRSQEVASEFCKIAMTKQIVEPSLLVHKHIVRGDKPNRDIEILVDGDPLTPSGNLGPYLAYLPWLIAIGSIGWFFRRRNRVRQLQEPDANSDA